jgi:hypothetical protein
LLMRTLKIKSEGRRIFFLDRVQLGHKIGLKNFKRKNLGASLAFEINSTNMYNI